MKRRHGFTLVELLVSMALIIFIMAILSQAFVAALGTFRNLKAQGDMAEKLRSVTQMLEHDLAADHFDGSRRLSDPTFWQNGPPQQGFFRIWQGSNPPASLNDFVEGYDPSGIGSYRSTDHYLAFTVKLRGNNMGNFMSASAAGSGAGGNLLMSAIQTFGPPEARYQATSGGAYNFQWGEVAWFLQPQVNPTTLTQDATIADPVAGTPTGLPLFTLYRRLRLLVPDNNLVSLDLVSKGLPPVIPIGQFANYLEMSCSPDTKTANNTLYFNNPSDITVPWRRFGMVPPNPTYLAYPAGLLYGAITPFVGPYPPWSVSWPAVVPLTPYPWGSWVPPNPMLPVPPTYPPYPGIPPQVPTPSYPTLAQQGASALLTGADIQLNDVISFDVRVFITDPITKLPLASNGIDPFVTLFQVPQAYQNNPVFYNQNTPPLNPSGPNLTGPAVFDTWTSLDDGLGTVTNPTYPVLWDKPFSMLAIPLWNSALRNGPIIKAIQITIRIWDFKTNQTRQVTIVQAM